MNLGWSFNIQSLPTPPSCFEILFKITLAGIGSVVGLRLKRFTDLVLCEKLAPSGGKKGCHCAREPPGEMPCGRDALRASSLSDAG